MAEVACPEGPYCSSALPDLLLPEDVPRVGFCLLPPPLLLLLYPPGAGMLFPGALWAFGACQIPRLQQETMARHNHGAPHVLLPH